jgi:hypothetical protein
MIDLCRLKWSFLSFFEGCGALTFVLLFILIHFNTAQFIMVTLALVFNLFFGNPANPKFVQDIIPEVSATVIVMELINP